MYQWQIGLFILLEYFPVFHCVIAGDRPIGAVKTGNFGQQAMKYQFSCMALFAWG